MYESAVAAEEVLHQPAARLERGVELGEQLRNLVLPHMLPGADRVDLVERLPRIVAGDEVVEVDVEMVVLVVVRLLLFGEREAVQVLALAGRFVDPLAASDPSRSRVP